MPMYFQYLNLVFRDYIERETKLNYIWMHSDFFNSVYDHVDLVTIISTKSVQTPFFYFQKKKIVKESHIIQ